MYKCEIIADSVCRSNRLTTFLVTYPRIIHAEMLRHRAFSRNSASSRAIPFEKMVKMVEEDPFVPIAWQKDHTGMQGSEYFNHELIGDLKYLNWVYRHDNKVTQQLEAEWKQALIDAIEQAKIINEIGLTKQLCNRLLEPFMYITEIITTSQDGLDNFFNLRCPVYKSSVGTFRSRKEAIAEAKRKRMQSVFDSFTELDWIMSSDSGADIHIQKIAEMMYDAYKENYPANVPVGEYHIPFGYDMGELSHGDKIKVAVARCARLSYKTLGDYQVMDYQADIRLYDRLLKEKHFSPFEHVAIAQDAVWKYGNFTGWRSHRFSIENPQNDIAGSPFADISRDPYPQMIRRIILDKVGVDIKDGTRKRDYFDARSIFCSAMRKRGYSFAKIGEFIDKDHATIMHGIKKADELRHTDKIFAIKYQSCMIEIDSVSNVNSMATTDSLINEIRMLKERINELTLYRDKYLELKQVDNG